MEGEVLMPNDEEFGAKLAEVIREFDGIAVSDDREAMEAKPVGDGAEEGIVFRKYNS